MTMCWRPLAYVAFVLCCSSGKSPSLMLLADLVAIFWVNSLQLPPINWLMVNWNGVKFGLNLSWLHCDWLTLFQVDSNRGFNPIWFEVGTGLGQAANSWMLHLILSQVVYTRDAISSFSNWLCRRGYHLFDELNSIDPIYLWVTWCQRSNAMACLVTSS